MCQFLYTQSWLEWYQTVVVDVQSFTCVVQCKTGGFLCSLYEENVELFFLVKYEKALNLLWHVFPSGLSV